ncbi:phage holin family protein [Actibacterium sp. 188UL27-1]|uniref:phage holin family protein n=1 Tax=Actibacterium sp. 188UL27-1 TaxID=2786961 RepID=UPI001959A0DD|nr:phage holin family protein [Actibacterium sp. 188UL27-1]
MFQSAKQTARRTARAVVLSTGALVCLTVGAAFLTVAAWFGLSAVLLVYQVALIIAAAYLGLGLVLLGCASLQTKSKPEPSSTSQSEIQGAIAQSFLVGLDAGRAARTRQES